MSTAITTYDHRLLDELGQAVDEAQSVYELIDWTSLLASGSAVPCPECGGRGTTNNGVFGATECFECGGKKVVDGDAPAAPPAPPFAQMRLRIGQARRALQTKASAVRDRLLADGVSGEALEGKIASEIGDRIRAGLMPPIELPSLASLQAMTADLRAKAQSATQKRLAGGAHGALSRGERGDRRLGRGGPDEVPERDVDRLEDDDRGSDDGGVDEDGFR